MATPVKIYYDAEGKTLTVWFDDPVDGAMQFKIHN